MEVQKEAMPRLTIENIIYTRLRQNGGLGKRRLAIGVG